MSDLLEVLAAINGVLWHEAVLLVLLGVGISFTVWSKLGQLRALTLGSALVFGRTDAAQGPGALTHLQALSAALSATVGIGNIGGVAVAVALGGPGAVFWMWVVGFIGMALKMTEVTLAMLYRRVDDPDNPHGGPMWVARGAFAARGVRWAAVGRVAGAVFCATLLVSTITGGNMFQAWNVAVVSEQSFGVRPLWTGVVLAVLVGSVILGGIKRIGRVAERIVPVMCGLYLLGAVAVVALRIDDLPAVLSLIFTGAFGSLTAGGAFAGATFGMAFTWGMKRAFFSNEAGQGSSPIAHAAAKTDEPASEGIVAGLEPFIDTLVVCSLTAFVILLSGAWNRPPAATLVDRPGFVVGDDGLWRLPAPVLPDRVDGEAWPEGDGTVFVYVAAGETQTSAKVLGSTRLIPGGECRVEWRPLAGAAAPVLRDGGVFVEYPGAALTGFAFDSVIPGFGRLIVSIAVWLFALSTMISWSYYGEQGTIYLFGTAAILPYKVFYCAVIVVACSGVIEDDVALDEFSSLGTGLMLFANVPITLLFAGQAMRALNGYVALVRRPRG